MAGKICNMSIIKEVLRQYHVAHIGKKAIANNLGISKNTVKKYIISAEQDSLSYKELIKLDDPVLQNRFNAGNPAYTDKRFDPFKEELDYYIKQLSNPHQTKLNLWEDYIQKNPEGYQYTQFCYHINQVLMKKPSITTILTDKYIPGEKIFVDFTGDTLYYIDRSLNKRIKCQVFVACLPFSNYSFAIAVHSQCQEDFIYALTRCFRALGGVPEVLVPDNLKAAVIKPSYKHSPTLNSLLSQVALHYNITIIPTKPYSPTHKALVEDLVKITYNRVFASIEQRTFFSLQELNHAIFTLLHKHNQKRMTDKPYSREEFFLSKERSTLQDLPDRDFDIKYTAKLKIREDCCIKLFPDMHYYSVPYKYVGRQVIVEYTQTIVKIFLKGKGDLIATHMRDKTMGEKTIQENHFAPNSSAIRNRTQVTYIEKAYEQSPLLGELVEQLFNESTVPAAFHYEQCERLLHLDKSDMAAYNFALKNAYIHGVHNVNRIINIYNYAKETQTYRNNESNTKLIPPTKGNYRGKSYYKY